MEAFFVLMFAAMGAGQNTALATDTGKARAARSRVFRILDRVREEELSVNPSYHTPLYTLYTPSLPYVHLCTPVIHRIYTIYTPNTHLYTPYYTPYIRPKTTY